MDFCSEVVAPACRQAGFAKGREILLFPALLLADWTGLNAVEAEILKADEAGLIETPVNPRPEAFIVFRGYDTGIVNP